MATGLGAAMVLAPDHFAGANERNDVVLPRSEWKASAFGVNAVPSDTGFSHASDSMRLVIPGDLAEERWTDAEQKRFHELAVEEAVGSLTPEEVVELEQLTILRRAYQSPRTGNEVLWEFEQRRWTDDLLKTLRKYVEFYDRADSARPPAREGSHRR